MCAVDVSRLCIVGVNELVLEPQYEQIARLQSQGRRLRAVGQPIAEAHRSVALPLVAHRYVDFEPAVLAAQILRLLDHAARRRARTDLPRCLSADGVCSVTEPNRRGAQAQADRAGEGGW